MAPDAVDDAVPAPEAARVANQVGAELLDLALELADEAMAMHRAGVGAAVADTKASATDPVTEVDRAVEAHVTARLTAARPDDAVIGEEGAAVAGSSGIEWVIDPVDGTVNFTYGFGQFSFSAAARVAGTSVVGVVADATRGEVFAARLGHGATLNGDPVTVRPCDSVATCLLATGFGYRPDDRARQGAIIARLLPRVRDIRRAGSAALDLAYVAAGRVDAYYEVGPNEWDLAAGALICTEAGGVVQWDPGRSRIVAASPGVAHEITGVIRFAESEVRDC